MGDNLLQHIREMIQRYDRLLELFQDEIQQLPKNFTELVDRFRMADESNVDDYRENAHLFEKKLGDLENAYTSFEKYSKIRDDIPPKGTDSVIMLHKSVDELRARMTNYKGNYSQDNLCRLKPAYNSVVREYKKYIKTQSNPQRRKRKRKPTPAPEPVVEKKTKVSEEEEEEEEDDGFEEDDVDSCSTTEEGEEEEEEELYHETVPDPVEAELRLEAPAFAAEEALKLILSNQERIFELLARIQQKWQLTVLTATGEHVRPLYLFNSKHEAESYGRQLYPGGRYEAVKVE